MVKMDEEYDTVFDRPKRVTDSNNQPRDIQ